MFYQVQLPYSYEALEPHIDALTMETHYSKHHATYTKNLNDAAEKAGVSHLEIVELLGSLDTIPDQGLRTALRNNGGGFYNHNLYFSSISPNGGGQPTGAFGDVFLKTFGSYESFQEQLTKLAVGQFGSGWAWLSANKQGELKLSASPNQDNPISEKTGFIPILALDVWEHAYYLKYKNLRPDYIKAFFEIIDWKAVVEHYKAVVEG